MDKLYKYLPEQFVPSLLDGNILFRNLVFFKSVEYDPRTDLHEGTHIDSPDNLVTLESRGFSVQGRFAFHTKLKKPEFVYCFCTSLHLTPALTKFGGACVEIPD